MDLTVYRIATNNTHTHTHSDRQVNPHFQNPFLFPRDPLCRTPKYQALIWRAMQPGKEGILAFFAQSSKKEGKSDKKQHLE